MVRIKAKWLSNAIFVLVLHAAALDDTAGELTLKYTLSPASRAILESDPKSSGFMGIIHPRPLSCTELSREGAG